MIITNSLFIHSNEIYEQHKNMFLDSLQGAEYFCFAKLHNAHCGMIRALDAELEKREQKIKELEKELVFKDTE